MKNIFLAVIFCIQCICASAQNEPKLIPVKSKFMPCEKPEWGYISVKYDVDAKMGTQDLSGTLSLRMKKDSILWFSVSAAMGIQVAKGMLVGDTLHLLDLYNKNYYAISLQEVSEKLHTPVGITQLQNLFIGLPLVDTCSPVNQKTDTNGQVYCAYPSSQGLYFITAFTPYLIKSYFAAQGNEIPKTAELRATELRHQEKPDDFVSVSYENWPPATSVPNPANPNAIAPIAMKKLPNYIYIQSQNAQDSAQIKMWLKNSRFDAIPSFPFNVTSEYTRMSLK
ncbi:MAG: DUF4292 domain-containing protein [Bacteroidetes bacterium]|nr:DUF4292 domain-containing protein [Bacteroidota bacterium]